LSGSGNLISIGNDFILGLRDKAILSQELITSLRSAGITVLAQAKKDLINDAPLGTWRDSMDLGLRGKQAIEWDQYLNSLTGEGIKLKDDSDQLLWTGGNASCQLSVKNAYLAYYSTLNL